MGDPARPSVPNNALPIALFAGLTDIIPFVGGYVASTPAIVAVIPNGTVTTIFPMAPRAPGEERAIELDTKVRVVTQQISEET